MRKKIITWGVTVYVTFTLGYLVGRSGLPSWGLWGVLYVLLSGPAIYVVVRQFGKRETPDTLSHTSYRFGGYVFDSITHSLTYQREVISCTPQMAKLLLGFARSPNFFLTNDEIAGICGWELDDLNLGGRRRKAISLLNKLFEADDSVQILFLAERNGYQFVFSK